MPLLKQNKSADPQARTWYDMTAVEETHVALDAGRLLLAEVVGEVFVGTVPVLEQPRQCGGPTVLGVSFGGPAKSKTVEDNLNWLPHLMPY